MKNIFELRSGLAHYKPAISTGNTMPNYRRDYTKGGTYFITAVLQDRRCDWLTRHIAAFRAAWQETAARYPYKTIAITILPEHFHAILQLPEDDDNYSMRISALKSAFSRRLPAHYRNPNPSQQNKQETGIWQRRFWEHRIRDESDLQRHVFYTYYNPVKHGYVRRVIDWPYTSFHRDVQRDLFPPDWGGEIEPGIRSLYPE